jgi:hypothetical protein
MKVFWPLLGARMKFVDQREQMVLLSYTLSNKGRCRAGCGENMAEMTAEVALAGDNMGGVVVQYLKSERPDEKVRMHGYDWDMLASASNAGHICILHTACTTHNEELYIMCRIGGRGDRVVFWNSGVIG